MADRKTMRAFVVEPSPPGASIGTVKDIPMPVPAHGEALIKVLRAGVCNTDLEILAGYMGFEGVLGHEFVGIVESVNGDEGAYLVGKRVCGDINLACTKCSVCQGGGDRARNHCPNRTVLGILGKHGTYAEYLTLPCRNLHQVPDGVSDAEAVFAEPLAAACRIMEQGLAPPDTTAAVLGDGKLGLLIAEVLSRRRTSKARPHEEGGEVGVTIIGRHPEKMDLCCRLMDQDQGEEGQVVDRGTGAWCAG
ncbi:unnamed protein product [Discosporangium mesarthrocarpum]